VIEKMNGKERTLKTLRHEEPDRVPLNVWMFRDDMRQRVIERFGNMETFYDDLNIDVFMEITPPPNKRNMEFLEEKMTMKLKDISNEDFTDPDDPSIYEGVRKLVETYGKEKCILAHVWGVLESAYDFMGVEETLLQFAMWTPEMKDLFVRLGEWSTRVAENVVELGIDVLHISGDAGSNGAMLISPDTWRERIAPYDAKIIAAGEKKGLPISLHSCGYIRPIIEDLLEMGIEAFHPLQQSTGMDLQDIKENWGDRLTIHGGLDIRYDLPRATEKELASVVKKNMLTCKPGGGFIFNTEHTVQPDTDLERLLLAYNIALEHSWY